MRIRLSFNFQNSLRYHIVNGVTPPFLEICEGEESITLSNTFYNNVDITNGISGLIMDLDIFDSDNIENPTYFPSEADFITGTITLNVMFLILVIVHLIHLI